MSHNASGKNYLFSKATGFRSDFTVVYDFYYILANLNLESDQSSIGYTQPSHLCQQDQFFVGLSVRNLQDS